MVLETTTAPFREFVAPSTTMLWMCRTWGVVGSFITPLLVTTHTRAVQEQFDQRRAYGLHSRLMPGVNLSSQKLNSSETVRQAGRVELKAAFQEEQPHAHGRASTIISRRQRGITATFPACSSPSIAPWHPPTPVFNLPSRRPSRWRDVRPFDQDGQEDFVKLPALTAVLYRILNSRAHRERPGKQDDADYIRLLTVVLLVSSQLNQN